jgi:membrane-associated phospholipid phosphatase
VDEPPGQRRRWVERVGVRLGVSALAVAALAVPFSLVLLLVEDHWRPLVGVDDGSRDALHGYALGHPGFARLMQLVSDSGSALAWQIITTALVLWLLWKRRFYLSLYVIVTVAGSSLINGLVKTAVDRARPVVPHPLVHEPGMSFPSGHAQAAIVGYAVVLIVLGPLLHRPARRVLTGFAALMVLAIGFSRIALAAHYVSDVLAAYLLGLAWVLVTTAVVHPRRLLTVRSHPSAHLSSPGHGRDESEQR